MHLRARLLRHALGLALLAALLGDATDAYRIDLVRRLDMIIYDARLQLTMPQRVDARIAIVDIDQQSLAEIGRWPWGRDRLADLVTAIFERHGAILLGLDLILAEADNSSGLPVLEALAAGTLHDDARFLGELKKLRPQLDRDRQLAAALGRHPVVLGYVFARAGRSSGVLPPPVLTSPEAQPERIAAPMWDSFSGNRPEFQEAVLAAGFLNGAPDRDGLSRRVPLLATYRGELYEALSLAMARVLTGSHRAVPVFAQAGQAAIEAIELSTARGPVRVPVDSHSMALVPFRGPQGSFPYHSAADILAGRTHPDALRGKIVLLGTTAPGLLDLRATPVGPAYPGVEVHANMLSGFLEGRIKAAPAYAMGADAALLLVVGALFLFVLGRASPQRATAAAAVLLPALAAANLALWHYAGIALPLAGSLLLALMLYGLHMGLGYFIEAHGRRGMAKLFGQYVPPELVVRMSRSPERYSMEGRSVELTVLFADIRGFTSVSEGMPPAQLARMMNQFFTAMTNVIRAHGGTLDKYIGDAIMAFWGAPVDDPEHARHALAAACAMQREMAAVNRTFEGQGWPALSIGVGLNTGTMIVGDMGSNHRKAYTVLGDAVNLGSRLEGLTAHYGTGIVIGEATRKALPEFACRELDRVQVKGRAGSVAVFEPICSADQPGAPDWVELALWNDALACYRAQDWDRADEMLERLTGKSPTSLLYPRYRERIAILRKRPPGTDWDGIWRFEAK